MSDDKHIVVVPNIEKEVPLPKNATEAFPKLSLEDEVEVRSNTIKLVSDIAGENIEPSKENQEKAKEIYFKNIMVDTPKGTEGSA